MLISFLSYGTFQMFQLKSRASRLRSAKSRLAVAVSDLCHFFIHSRLIETDVKSMNSLQSGHSRRSSDTSQISVTSNNSFNEAAAAAAMAVGMSPADVNPEEDLWTTWGKLINEWEARVSKRQLPQGRVCQSSLKSDSGRIS